SLNPKESNQQRIGKQNHLSRLHFLRSLAVGGVGVMAPKVLSAKSHEFQSIKVVNKAPQAGGRPNIVIIFDDQLRRNALGFFGGGSNITPPNAYRLSS